jgi:hypothetical protein
MTLAVSGESITFNDLSVQNTAPTGFGFKNRIINGDMRIDQRNAGASVTPTDGQYTLDRWRNFGSQASKYSVQRNAGSVATPTGFTNYLGITSLATTTVGSSDYFLLRQNIEGFNVADLSCGTANAQPVTLSFWVRSSLTGTFGGSLQNGTQNRSYPFSYTISAANTWEQKSVTIAGDTTGAWITDNGIGIIVNFGLGVGSTQSGTAGAWNSNNNWSTTGATSVVGTSGATFYITGVQLEKGSTATSFDYRDYGRELVLCQRYFETSYLPGNAVGSTASPNSSIAFYVPATGNYQNNRVDFAVSKRSSPTIVLFNPVTGTTGQIRNIDLNTNLPAFANFVSTTGFMGSVDNVSVSVSIGIGFHYTAQSEL